MTARRTVRAVVDRFEGDLAVLMIGDEPMDVPRKVLPRKVREGDYLEVTLEDGHIVGVKIDHAETERARQRIAEKLERLRRGDHLREESDTPEESN